mmetsp:Transcript_34052/g.79537  ORF Transcript_34052/g.79537 Transcript_34052/m.79537 type:complete len:98 (+) Transcript_34052:127-420(+)
MRWSDLNVLNLKPASIGQTLVKLSLKHRASKGSTMAVSPTRRGHSSFSGASFRRTRQTSSSCPVFQRRLFPPYTTDFLLFLLLPPSATVSCDCGGRS